MFIDFYLNEWNIILSGVFGLFAAWILYQKIISQPEGSDKMKKIAESIHLGAMAFLKAEYRQLAVFVAAVALLLFFGFSWGASLAFVLGAFCSALAGFIGMKAATRGNVRTAEAAAKEEEAKALLIAFNGGAVMGLSVASLGLLGLGGLYLFWTGGSLFSEEGFINNINLLPIISGFSMGASSIALFARIGGGIFTKAADVGSDLVGKLEAGIP